MDYTKHEMLNKALEAFGDLGEDEELGPADWPTVQRYITSLNNIEGEPIHPHNASESDNNLDPMNVKDIRIRLLNGKLNILPLRSGRLLFMIHDPSRVLGRSVIYSITWISPVEIVKFTLVQL